MTETATNRKEAAMNFLKLASAGKIRESAQRYVSPKFRHHNPYFRGDAESLISAMEENAAQNPHKILEIQHAVQENDLVAVHSRVKLKPADPAVALIHIFRFEGDLIAELWDIAQPEPEHSPNENGMF